MNRVRTLAWAMLSLSTFWMSPTVVAADADHATRYPTKPVRLVVAHVAGGAVDMLGRALAQRMSELWGQSIVIENRAGAAGTVGAAAVAKAAPDGYTLLLSTNAPITTNLALYRKLDYDANDIEPVAIAAVGAVVVMVHPSLPVKSMAELIELARQRPGTLSAASAGSGSIGHFAVSELRKMFGAQMTHIPYKGGVPAVVAVATNEVQVGIIDPGASAPFIKDGRVRALAATGAQRSSSVPEVPTLIEAGVPGFDVLAWVAFTAPRGMPAELVSKINGDVRRVVQEPQLRQRIINAGLEPIDGGTPEVVAAFYRKEVVRWRQRVEDAQLKVE